MAELFASDHVGRLLMLFTTLFLLQPQARQESPQAPLTNETIFFVCLASSNETALIHFT
jgi:hypothetical protein